MLVLLDTKKIEKEKKIVSVHELYGNLNLFEDDSTIPIRSKFNIQNKSTFVSILKKHRLVSKNYATMYITKSKILISILVNILEEYIPKLTLIHANYAKIQTEVKVFYEKKALEPQQVEMMTSLRLNTKDMPKLIKDAQAKLSEIKGQLFVSLESSEAQSPLTACGMSATGQAVHKVYDNSKHVLMFMRLQKYFRGFVGAYSHLVRKYEKENKKILYFAENEKNYFLHEFEMALTANKLKYMLIQILERIYAVHEKINHLLQDSAGIVKFLFPEGSTKIDQSMLSFRISSLLYAQYRRFVKKKIILGDKNILQDDDLKQFFVDCYPFLYPQFTPLYTCLIRCSYEVKDKTKPHVPIIIVIDVSLSSHSRSLVI